jgi:predicted  nucleic acid-binding Zn-ribbon protein
VAIALVCLLTLFVLYLLPAAAQEQKLDAPKPLDDATALAVRNAQHAVEKVAAQLSWIRERYKEHELAMAQLDKKYAELHAQLDAAQKDLSKASAEAFLKSGADPAKYQLDLEALKVVEKSKTANGARP